jgi:hypothetical protein
MERKEHDTKFVDIGQWALFESLHKFVTKKSAKTYHTTAPLSYFLTATLWYDA